MTAAGALPSGADAAGPATPGGAAFSAKVVLAIILVGVFSFSALVVLSAYAPDLRSGSDGRGHALSRSAIGFAGAVVMLKAQGDPVLISRSSAAAAPNSLLIATPGLGDSADDLKDLGILPPAPQSKPDGPPAQITRQRTLVIMPKWVGVDDPIHRGWVSKGPILTNDKQADLLFKGFGAATHLARRKGVSRPKLRSAADGAITGATGFRLGPVDQLQTISGPGWTPVLVDEAGRALLVESADRRVFVLADPDLLNTQGLANLDTARAGMAIVEALRPPGGGVVFDVTLNGFKRERSLLRVMLEPPFLGATLCALMATILTGLHAIVRFGPPLHRGRAVPLGKAALVDNSAGLIRMSGKEPQLGVTYGEQVQAMAAKAVGSVAAAGGARTDQLAALGEARRSSLNLKDLIGEAARARTRADLLACARRLHQWRLEITRERE